MRSILVIKCFQIILSISTLQNKHSLLFGRVTHLGIVIGKMLGMERLFYIKEKQGMQTMQMLSSTSGFWKGARHSGARDWHSILVSSKSELVLYSCKSNPTSEAGTALCAMQWL